jgi:hypothetical protein
MKWTESEIRTYLTFIIGRAPQQDAEGNVKIPGPSGFCHQRGHQALMDSHTGAWDCPHCCSGPFEDYEARRSGIFSTCMYPERRASEAIREIIRQETDLRLERAQHAQALARQLALPRPAARILRQVYRRHESSRRFLQQISHQKPREFRDTIIRLERNGLVTHMDLPSTGGRQRRVYSPATIGGPPTCLKLPLSKKNC